MAKNRGIDSIAGFAKQLERATTPSSSLSSGFIYNMASLIML
jgi:hypothetical protein